MPPAAVVTVAVLGCCCCDCNMDVIMNVVLCCDNSSSCCDQACNRRHFGCCGGCSDVVSVVVMPYGTVQYSTVSFSDPLVVCRDGYPDQHGGGEDGAGLLRPRAGQRLQADRLAGRPGGPAQGRRLSGRPLGLDGTIDCRPIKFLHFCYIAHLIMLTIEN
jgi:hypothetical protein